MTAATREPLTTLDPTWLATGPGRHGMGVSFKCPHPYPPHGPHCRVIAWFFCPIDAGMPATKSEALPRLYDREGESFEDLTVWGPISHGSIHVVLYDGMVSVILV